MLAALSFGLAATASAQTTLSKPLNLLDGPPAPIAPAVVARDAEGRATVRATRISEPIVLDGKLDDAVYNRVTAIADFVQQEPAEGQPVTEKTEVWMFFDDRNIYVAARCWDSQPDREVANEMRRDGQGTNDNESFGVVLDTFYDRRNGFLFQVALAGGLFDGYITDERDMNRDWNTVWDGRTARFEEGWTVELAIPFKSLRFKAGREQIWGVNFKRVVRWKNEMQYLTRIPASLGRRGINKLSSAGTLVGIEPPQSGRNFEVKPYGISGAQQASPLGGATATKGQLEGGVDVKLGLTEGLTADATYNTDFAQVEEDEQQVNLTRFSVLFPEKRDFFLEGQGIFAFGGVQGTTRAGGGSASSGPSPGNPVPNDVPVVFFSRRIGLDAGVEVPIDVGGRVTGKAGPYSIGIIDIRTRDVSAVAIPPTNFGVIRIKRDILRRSAVGILYTDRSNSSFDQSSASRAAGVDGVFSFYENLNINTYLAKSGVSGDKAGTSYRAQLDYNGDRYGFQLERLAAGDHFNPDIGFMRRLAFNRNSGYLRFSPRPTKGVVRKYIWEGSLDYITNPAGRLESRETQGVFRGELQNGDSFSFEGISGFESLAKPFEIAPGVTIPVGSYGFPFARLQYGFGPQRKASGFVTVETGAFYDGSRTSISTGRSRVEITPQLSVEPNISINWVNLPYGDFTNTLLTARTSYTVTPRMAFSALVQYNSTAATYNTNARFRWEYQPGSDLFVVYTDNRDTTFGGFPQLRNRAFVVKATRLFRM